MAIQTKTFVIVCLGLIASNLLAVGLAAYYSLEVQNLNELLITNESEVSVNLCLDYQSYDETIVWYNNTVLPFGSTLWNLTNSIAVVEADDSWIDSLGAHYITAINGVREDGSNAHHWMWTYWDDSQLEWVYGNVGADLYILSNNDIIRWRYENPYTSGYGG
jgi:hypothetical protein